MSRWCPCSQIDRTKKPSVRVSDITKPSQDGPPSQNGPSAPDRSVKPHFDSGVAPSDDQDRSPEEDRRDGDRQEKLSEEKERQESERQRKEDEERKYQERKKLERQKAEEEEEEESKEGRGGERRGNSDTPTKSASLDSPAANRVITEIKVSVCASGHSTPLSTQVWYLVLNTSLFLVELQGLDRISRSFYKS